MTEVERQISQVLLAAWNDRLGKFDLVVDPNGVGRFVRKSGK